MKPMDSGSIHDWEHTPNLTPRGFEIKKDELYVLSGDALVKIYHLLMNQRMASLMTLSRLSPINVAEYEQYLSLSKHINLVMYDVLNSLPLLMVMQMQDESRMPDNEIKSFTPGSKRSGILTLKQLLDKFHLSEGGKDEMKPPNPTDETPTA